LTHGARDRTQGARSVMQPDATSPAPAAAQELEQEAVLWLVIALVSSVLCLGLALGIGGAIFCYLARQAAAQGLTADAEAKLKWGKILTLAGSVLGVLTSVLALIFR
jgi:hypothetical protein